jgi:putative membrane protein
MHIALVLLAAASLNDPQVATIALTAHQIDVDRGKLALKHTKNDEVKQFADQMVHDHEAGIKEAMNPVKNVLVPSAQNADLKRLLETAVPTLEGHLQHAKMVQAQLAKM